MSAYRGYDKDRKDGGGGQLYGKFSLIDLAGNKSCVFTETTYSHIPPTPELNPIGTKSFFGVANQERLSDVDIFFPRFPTVTHFSRVCQ